MRNVLTISPTPSPMPSPKDSNPKSPPFRSAPAVIAMPTTSKSTAAALTNYFSLPSTTMAFMRSPCPKCRQKSAFASRVLECALNLPLLVA
jgi:hypothetical protein